MSFTKPEWAWQAFEARITELENALKLAGDAYATERELRTDALTRVMYRDEEISALKTRLGAVIALCDRVSPMRWGATQWYVEDFRAAATGDAT